MLKQERMALAEKWIFGQSSEQEQKRLKEIDLWLECSQIAEPSNNGQLEIGKLFVISKSFHHPNTDKMLDIRETCTGILVEDNIVSNPHLIPATSPLGRHIKGLTVNDNFHFMDDCTLVTVKGSILDIRIPTESEIKMLRYNKN